MNILLLGHFNPDYPRNRLLIQALKNLGHTAILVRDSSWWLKRWGRLARQIFVTDHEIVMVPYAYLAGVDVLLAWGMTRLSSRKIIFDAFISLYDTYILDKHHASRLSLKAGAFWLVDWLSVHLADHLLVDTQANKLDWITRCGVSADKISIILVGTDIQLFHPSDCEILPWRGSWQFAGKKQTSLIPKQSPRHLKEDTFMVGFWGYFSPMHGVDIIIQAAAKLKKKPIHFYLLGNGQERRACEALAKQLKLKQITFLDSLPYDRLPHFIHSLDLVLGGPFGASPKAQRVIPNKAFEALGCAKPLIVADSPTMRGIFTEKQVIFCPAQNATQLASFIDQSRRNPKQLAELGIAGRKWVTRYGSVERIERELEKVVGNDD